MLQGPDSGGMIFSKPMHSYVAREEHSTYAMKLTSSRNEGWGGVCAGTVRSPAAPAPFEERTPCEYLNPMSGCTMAGLTYSV
jgi:hypothetical protein